MAVAGGVLNARFREGTSQVRRLEVRVVTESAFTPRILEYATFYLSAAALFAASVAERGDAYVPGAVRKFVLSAPSGRGHPRDELGIVRRVQRLTIEILATRPSLAVDTRLSAQNVDAHPRVVAKSWFPRQLKEVARLCERVLFEGLVAFQLFLCSAFRDAEARHVGNLETKLGEDLAQLAQLAGAPSGEKKDLTAHSDSAFVCAVSSERIPAIASSSSWSSWARSKVPCSPVPCTSTNFPSLLMTTFMSTSALTSSS